MRQSRFYYAVIQSNALETGLHGACAPEVLRPECAAGEFDCTGSHAPDRSFVCHRGARRRHDPGSGTAKAVDYSPRRWAALSRYATDGRLPIDNNSVENTTRPIALGKKHWLFAGSEYAGITR